MEINTTGAIVPPDPHQQTCTVDFLSSTIFLLLLLLLLFFSPAFPSTEQPSGAVGSTELSPPDHLQQRGHFRPLVQPGLFWWPSVARNCVHLSVSAIFVLDSVVACSCSTFSFRFLSSGFGARCRVTSQVPPFLRCSWVIFPRRTSGRRLPPFSRI